MIPQNPETSIFGLSPDNLVAIVIGSLSAVITILGLLYVRKTFKSNKPRIVSCDIFDKIINIEIVNPSQTGITITNIYIRKRFNPKRIECSWHHPEKSYPITGTLNDLRLSSSFTQYVFTGQASYEIRVASTLETKSTYKIVVKTTDGRCTSTFRPDMPI